MERRVYAGKLGEWSSIGMLCQGHPDQKHRDRSWPLAKFKNLAKVVAIWVALGDPPRGPALLKRNWTLRKIAREMGSKP